MSLRINNNIASLNAYRNLSVNDNLMAKSLEKRSSVFPGTASTFQVGAGASDQLTVTVDSLASNGVGTSGTDLSAVDLTSSGDAAGAIATIDQAIASLSSQRATLGATQNRFEHKI